MALAIWPTPRSVHTCDFNVKSRKGIFRPSNPHHKGPEKPGDWDLKPGDFQNMCQIKRKQQIICLGVFFLPF